MLPKMRPYGDPQDGPRMQCLHCGQVMGMDLLLQIAHSNFCPPPEPPTAPKAARISEAPPVT